MVFTELYIIKGVIVTKEQVRAFVFSKIPDYQEEDDETLPELIGTANSILEKEKYPGVFPRFFDFPCCSKLNDVKAIYGWKAKSYHRRMHRCKNCDKYSVCDKCICSTENGFYDVNKIIDEPVEVNPKHLCENCDHDHRYENFMFCSVCGTEESDIERKSNYQFEQFPGPVKYYYCLNDCLSCT